MMLCTDLCTEALVINQIVLDKFVLWFVNNIIGLLLLKWVFSKVVRSCPFHVILLAIKNKNNSNIITNYL